MLICDQSWHTRSDVAVFEESALRSGRSVVTIFQPQDRQMMTKVPSVLHRAGDRPQELVKVGDSTVRIPIKFRPERKTPGASDIPSAEYRGSQTAPPHSRK